MTVIPSAPTLPLVPLPGTADLVPLLSILQYQEITGDTTTEPDDVKEAIDEAIVVVCNECTRTLLYGQYQEVQYLYPNGMVFPSAVPIDPTKSISSNTVIFNPGDPSPGSVIQGWGVWVGWFTPLPWMPVWSGVFSPQTDVTYWGGYTSDTIPPKLRRLIAKIAYRSIIANNDSLRGIPGGVKSVSVNGVSMSGDLAGFQLIDIQTKKDLRRFKRPQVEAWQS